MRVGGGYRFFGVPSRPLLNHAGYPEIKTGGEMGKKKLLPSERTRVMRKFLSDGLLYSAGRRAVRQREFFLKICALRIDKVDVGYTG